MTCCSLQWLDNVHEKRFKFILMPNEGLFLGHNSVDFSKRFLGALGETSWKSCPKIIYPFCCRPYSTGVILWSKYVSLDQLFRKTFIGLKSGIVRLKFIRSRVNYTWILRPVFQLWVLLSDFARNRKRFFPNLFVTSQNRALVSCTCVKTLFADGGTYKFTDGGT